VCSFTSPRPDNTGVRSPFRDVQAGKDALEHYPFELSVTNLFEYLEASSKALGPLNLIVSVRITRFVLEVSSQIPSHTSTKSA
jgi:hypothetical protein